jgi:hypothetical protein
MRTDGRTDMTKVVGAFRNYAKVSKVVNEIWQVVEDYEVSQIVFHHNPPGNSIKMMTKNQVVELRSNRY